MTAPALAPAMRPNSIPSSSPLPFFLFPYPHPSKHLLRRYTIFLFCSSLTSLSLLFQFDRDQFSPAVIIVRNKCHITTITSSSSTTDSSGGIQLRPPPCMLLPPSLIMHAQMMVRDSGEEERREYKKELMNEGSGFGDVS